MYFLNLCQNISVYWVDWHSGDLPICGQVLDVDIRNKPVGLVFYFICLYI